MKCKEEIQFRYLYRLVKKQQINSLEDNELIQARKRIFDDAPRFDS